MLYLSQNWIIFTAAILKIHAAVVQSDTIKGSCPDQAQGRSRPSGLPRPPGEAEAQARLRCFRSGGTAGPADRRAVQRRARQAGGGVHPHAETLADG